MLSIPEAFQRLKRLTAAVRAQLDTFLVPFATVLPDVRYRRLLRLLVEAILAAGSLHPITAAAYVPDPLASPWAVGKCSLRLLHTPRFSHHRWLEVFLRLRRLRPSLRGGG